MNQTPEIAIRLARATFNRALAEGDLAAIERLLMPGAMLVTGTDSALLSGRKAQLTAWKREFQAAERTLYIRTPERIAASTIEPIALEHGTWQGVTAKDRAPIASGDYCAKWRRLEMDWRIEAELYLTLA